VYLAEQAGIVALTAGTGWRQIHGVGTAGIVVSAFARALVLLTVESSKVKPGSSFI
jgi:hypothetical protein